MGHRKGVLDQGFDLAQADRHGDAVGFFCQIVDEPFTDFTVACGASVVEAEQNPWRELSLGVGQLLPGGIVFRTGLQPWVEDTLDSIVGL